MSALSNPNLPSSPLYIDAQAPATRRIKFTTGDAVRGTVRVKPTARPQRVTVALKGRLVFDGTEVWLFERELILFTSSTSALNYDIVGMGVADDSRVGLPFEFQFPELVELKHNAAFTKREGFEFTPGHILPPSFAYETAIYRRNLIEYFLEANMWQTSTSTADLTAVQNIGYMPPTPPLHREDMERFLLPNPPEYGTPVGIRIRTHKLLQDHESAGNLLGKMKHRMVKYDPATPAAVFAIEARIPHIVIIGLIFPVFLTIEHIERSELLPQPPAVFIRRIRIQLLPLLIVRHPSRPLQDYTRGSKQVLLDCEFDGQGQLLYEDLNVNNVVGHHNGRSLIERNAIPSFKSYSINLKYEIEVRLWGECATQAFDRVICRGPITVCSSYNTNSDTEHQSGKSKVFDGRLGDVKSASNLNECHGDSDDFEGVPGPSNSHNHFEDSIEPPKDEEPPEYDPPAYADSSGDARLM